MNTSYSGWYVLHVKHQHEKKIHQKMQENKLNTFLPTIMSVRQWSDRKKKLEVPLIPSYIFIHLRSKIEFYEALRIKGVFRYLKFGNKFAIVRQEEIQRIKTLLKIGKEIEVNSFSPNLIKGDKMYINYGPLYGLNCEVIRVGAKNRIVVRIDSLKKNIIATVPLCILSHANKDWQIKKRS